MRRFRLSTLMLLVVIAALGLGLAVQELRHRRREAEQQARLAVIIQKYEQEQLILTAEIGGLQFQLNAQDRSSVVASGVGDGK